MAQGPTAAVRRRWRRGCGRPQLRPAARPLPSPSWEDDHPTLNWQGLGSGGRTRATPSSLSRLALNTSLLPGGPSFRSGRRASLWKAGGRRAGRRAASERGARARGQRPRDRFLPLLVHVLSPGWRAHGGASVLDAEVDCSMDVILVGSSELSAPPSPEPCRGEGPPGAKPSVGMPAPGWAALRAPGFWNIPTAFRHLAGPGGPHPETVPWARMIDVPGNAEGLGCRRPRLPGLQKINLWHLFLAVFKSHVSRRKGPLLNFLSQISLHMKSGSTSET